MLEEEKLNSTVHYTNHQNQIAMKTLTAVTETHFVDIEFQDLYYTVKDGFKSDTKTILNKINGKFYSGELTAILGPSGSGKTTLLNALAGYGTKRVMGSIKINNRNREYQMFRKLSTYIMQDIVHQPLLTVHEVMVVSAELKLGRHVIFDKKLAIIDEILTVLGLKGCCNTMTEQLSGGESRRLSIALELVNNPSVILLDEPTTGLDIVAMTQCLETLKVLTKQGRTIICSIHQPSASSFLLFDQVYFMANGMCVYSGSPDNTLSYLSSSGLHCPTTYSPTEYLIELVQIHQECIHTLVENAQNGRTNRWHQKTLIPVKECNMRNGAALNVYHETTEIVLDIGFATSFWTQFTILFRRMMLQQSRNKLSIGIQILHHIICAILYGTLFLRIGNNALTVQYTFGFCVCVMVFFVFTHVMVPVLLFPTEIVLLKREYDNRWYGLKAYYLAVMLRSLPLIFILGMVFLTIVYLMSSQPMELSRFALFATSGILVGIGSEGLGQTFGAILRVTNGAFVAPLLVAPMVIISVYGIGYAYESILLPIRIAMSLDYVRFGLTAQVIALLANREKLECFEVFCPYNDLHYYLRALGMDNMTCGSRILPLLGFVIFFKLVAYLALKYRLNPELEHIFTTYSCKFIQCKLF